MAVSCYVGMHCMIMYDLIFKFYDDTLSIHNHSEDEFIGDVQLQDRPFWAKSLDLKKHQVWHVDTF